jgi:hypothetical protein
VTVEQRIDGIAALDHGGEGPDALLLHGGDRLIGHGSASVKCGTKPTSGRARARDLSPWATGDQKCSSGGSQGRVTHLEW